MTLTSVSVLVFQCYMFHMYVGVRAGGGIGDEIEDPAGDEYEIYRIIFDITFFFFVIVILLAIIQGKPYPAVAPGCVDLKPSAAEARMQVGLTVSHLFCQGLMELFHIVFLLIKSLDGK